MKTTTVYLYHFDHKFSHAQHYIGSCKDIKKRDWLHQNGLGAKLLHAVRKKGIKFWIVRTWPGGRQLERQLKNRKNAAKLCPICRAKKAKNTVPGEVNFY